MNRFIDYFGRFPKYDRVELELGTFELRRGFDDNRSRLVYIDRFTSSESILSLEVRHIKPLGDHGVACFTIYPQGDRRIKIYSLGEGVPYAMNGYIRDKEHLYYVSHGALRCCYKRFKDYEVISAKDFKALGFEDVIRFEDDYIRISAKKDELISFTYIDYNGVPDEKWEEI